MLIPQYSLRRLLAIMTGCAGVFSIFAMATNGSVAAAGVSIAIIAAVIVMLVHAALFAVVWLVSVVLPKRSPAASGPPPEGDGAILSRSGPVAATGVDRREKGPPSPGSATAMLLAAAVLWGWCGPAAAQTSPPTSPKGPYSLIRGLTSSGSGLTMAVDPAWPDGPGYRPVRVLIAPWTPPAADRTITLELLLHRNYRAVPAIRVVQDVEIPAGSRPMEATLSVPQLGDWSMWRINVYEDGDLLPGLTLRSQGRGGVTSLGWGQELPQILFVGDDLPELRELSSLLFLDQSGVLRGPGQVPAPGELPTAAACQLLRLPERWIDYSTLDMLCLSLQQLADLQKQRPAAFRAILDWTAAGGNLWVSGLGKDWQRLGELEKLAGFAVQSGGVSDPSQRGWQAPDKAIYGQATDDQGAAVMPGFSQPADEAAAQPQPRASKPPPSPPARPHFLLRPLGMGLVVAFAAETPFPGNRDDWAWVLDTMGRDRWLWSQRHGLLPGLDNPDFWNFLIPGAGVAPVKEFCVLITLFAIGIGPVNYWILRRRRRLYLLTITTPAIALLVTMLLLGYAVLADGLQVRLRVRSITQIDQRHGQAVCWSRLSYFAGLAPSGGLRFPADVAVLPLEHVGSDSQWRQVRERKLIWEDDQRLVSGWLASRTPTQFLTVRSRPSDVGLDVSYPNGAAAPPAVRNRLDTPIQQLLLRTKDGKYHAATDVDREATVTLQPVEPAEAFARLRKCYHDELPVAPPGMENSYRGGGVFGINQRRPYQKMRRYPGSGRASTPLAQQSGRLEQVLADLVRNGNTLEPGSYIAIVDRSPEVVFGVASPREEKGYHVIVGKW